jgi:hypothetical protein
MGYVFNPVSFWFCHNQQHQLGAVLCEVNNTFGERHYYLLHNADLSPITEHQTLCSQKVFHVSPFYPVDGEYKFQFKLKENQRYISIDYFKNNTLNLKTAISGKAISLRDRHLLTTFLSMGFATVMVVYKIHWQALKLWIKGATFHKKPSPPKSEITK